MTIQQKKTNGDHEAPRLSDELLSLQKNLDEIDRTDVRPTQMQVQTAIEELVEIVDDYFAFSACTFYPSPNFGKFNISDLWQDQWVRSIDPRLAANEKRVARYEQFLDAIFAGKDTGRTVMCTLSNAISNLKTEHAILGFYAGVLVGAKMLGASKEQLDHFGRRLIKVLT